MTSVENNPPGTSERLLDSIDIIDQIGLRWRGVEGWVQRPRA